MSRDFFQQTHKLLESEKVVTFVPLICSAIDFAMVSKDLSLFNLITQEYCCKRVEIVRQQGKTNPRKIFSCSLFYSVNSNHLTYQNLHIYLVLHQCGEICTMAIQYRNRYCINCTTENFTLQYHFCTIRGFWNVSSTIISDKFIRTLPKNIEHF